VVTNLSWLRSWQMGNGIPATLSKLDRFGPKWELWNSVFDPSGSRIRFWCQKNKKWALVGSWNNIKPDIESEKLPIRLNHGGTTCPFQKHPTQFINAIWVVYGNDLPKLGSYGNQFQIVLLKCAVLAELVACKPLVVFHPLSGSDSLWQGHLKMGEY